MEIEAVIHPFTPTDGERIVHTDCGFGLRAEEVGDGGRGEREKGKGS